MASKKEQARLTAAKRREERRKRREQAALEKDQSLTEAAQKRQHAKEVKAAKKAQLEQRRLGARLEAETVKHMARICKATLPPDKPVSFDLFNRVSGLPVMLGCVYFGVAPLEEVLGCCHRPIRPVNLPGTSIGRIFARLECRYPGQKAALIARFNATPEDMVLTNWNLAPGNVRKNDGWMRCCVKGKTYILQTFTSFSARLRREKLVRR